MTACSSQGMVGTGATIASSDSSFDYAVLPQDRAVQGGQPEQAGWYSLLTIILFLLCILPGAYWLALWRSLPLDYRG